MAFDILSMSDLGPEYVSEIDNLIHDIFETGGERRDQQIQRLIQEVSPHLENDVFNEDFLASVGLFFNAAFGFITAQQQVHNGELNRFFRIINHLPVLGYCRFYDQTMEILKPYFEQDPSYVQLFDRLQLLYLYSEIGYEDAALHLAEELSSELDSAQLGFYTMYQLSKARVLAVQGNTKPRMELMLDLATRIWDEGGPEATLFLMTHWLFSLSWFKSSKYCKAVLYNLYEKIRGVECLNTARVGYELFLLDDKQVAPPEKMRYYQDLIKFQDTILNSRQLHSLHFFAGNYLSGFQERFHDSIHSFKASNYFLHKCWERLIEISRYLRTHCEPRYYKLSMRYVENNFLQLSNQTSLRNNSYVENLQMNFQKIEELYREVGELSLTDQLTGQRNRRFMDNNLMPILALAARQNVPVCFTILDIDDFKEVNDQYGHTAGDYILKELGMMLSRTFRHSDIIVRYGGDEFLIVLFDTNSQHCREMMDGFRKKIEKRVFEFQDEQMKITASIGAYCEDFTGKVKLKDLKYYINIADMVMYEAKKSGRNAVFVRE